MESAFPKLFPPYIATVQSGLCKCLVLVHIWRKQASRAKCCTQRSLRWFYFIASIGTSTKICSAVDWFKWYECVVEDICMLIKSFAQHSKMRRVLHSGLCNVPSAVEDICCPQFFQFLMPALYIRPNGFQVCFLPVPSKTFSSWRACLKLAKALNLLLL